MNSLHATDLGTMPFGAALERMLQDVLARSEDRIPDTLLLVRHPPVITVGRKRGAAASILDSGGVPVVEVERGGDVTYHGPGQQVLYPILKLEGADRDLHRLLRRLEQSVIATLAVFGLVGERLPGQTGVWVGDRKIASIGIAVRRWVTYHGVALDVAPDPGFAAIRPCGLDSAVMTSVEEQLQIQADPLCCPVSFDMVRPVWLTEFCRVFDRELGGPVTR